MGKTKKPPVYDWWLVLVSLLFYGYYGWALLLYPIVSCLINYCFIIKLRQGQKKKLLTLAICLNVLSLACFKYIPISGIIVPLGISFITFGQIAYLVDSFKGVTSCDSLLEYLLYIMWFPKLSQGPLLKHDDFMNSLRNKDRLRVNYDNMSQGLFFLTIGMFKKKFIADNIALAVNYIIDFPEYLGRKTVLLLIFGYTLQIYMDFSGYSDMALGISKMFNIDIPVNFNSPYKADSVTDFWKRWHISLTDFLREYIYFPLGGSRKGKVRTCVNIMLVYLISGIWHGSGFTFILWGLFHGLCQVTERLTKPLRIKIPKFIRIVTTFTLVSLGWLMFRVKDVKTFITVLSNTFKSGDPIINIEAFNKCSILGLSDIWDRFGRLGSFVESKSSLIVLIFGLFICFFTPNLYEKKYRFSPLLCLATVILLTYEILSLGGIMTSFIYFNF